MKGKIRAPRRVGAGRNAPSGDDVEANWELLRSAFLDIHNENNGQLSFEQLYRASYKIVLRKRGDYLYDRVKDFEQTYLSDVVIPKIWALVTRSLVAATLHRVPGTTVNERLALGSRLLRGVRGAWQHHNLAMNMEADVLMYLDRGYAQEAHVPLIYATAIGLFRDHLLLAPLPRTIWSPHDQNTAAIQANTVIDLTQDVKSEVKTEPTTTTTTTTTTTNAGGSGIGISRGRAPDGWPTIFTVFAGVILEQINMDREGDVVDRTLLRSCVAMLEALYKTDSEHEDDKLYRTLFEPEFLLATRKFYRAECERLLREGDARLWLRQTQRRLREEQDRCGHTVSQETKPLVTRVLEAELIAAHLEDFIQMEGSGLKAMVDNDRYDDLSILYDLVSRVEGKPRVLNQFLQARIVSLGLEIEKALRETDFSVAPGAAAEAAAADDGGAGPSSSGKAAAAAAASLSSSAQQTAAAIKWVNDILELKEKFDQIWERCFKRDLAIQTVIHQGLTELFRLCARSAEYVSLFIDDCFKRGLRGKSDAEVDMMLDKATVMVQHVAEKDLLERYYQKHLARRLLHNKSENPEAEKLLISRMQAELGKTFTAKFEGMFKDMAMSEELTQAYATYVREQLGGGGGSSGGGAGGGDGDEEPPRIDLAVHVLTSNNWPPEVMGRTAPLEGEKQGGGNAQATCVYPAAIQRLQASFLKFYLSDRTGRVLTWVGSAGSADMRCVFPRIAGHDKGPLSRERRYEVHAPTHCMVVLMLFNNVGGAGGADGADDAPLSFEEIQEQTQIATPELTRALASLSIPPRCRLLVKTPASRTVRAGDTFAFNAAFVSKTLKIKVPVINAQSKLEGEEERKATEKENDQTRWHTVDAAVVRIMKQRKELTHTALVTEVVTQLVSRFRPEVAMVKKRIEDLITREYLERIEESEPPAYRYVA